MDLYHFMLIKKVFMLIDFRHKPTKDDLLMYNYLKYFNLPVTIVATKVDKVTKGQWDKYKNIIQFNEFVSCSLIH